VTAACRLVPVTRDGYASVRDACIALENDIRIDTGMLRARHHVALAGNTATVVAHRVGCGDDFTAVVGGVAESDEIDH